MIAQPSGFGDHGSLPPMAITDRSIAPANGDHGSLPPMAITDRSIGQLIESTITITTISSQEPVLIRTADRTPAWVAMEDLLQEVQLQLQHQQKLIEHQQMLIEQQQQSIMTLREMMHEQDHEQQQQWILMQELGRDHQESIMQVRKQMLQH